MSRKHRTWAWMRPAANRLSFRLDRRGTSATESGLHLLAIVLGIVGAIMVIIAVMLHYGYVAPSAVDGITESTAELYAGLAIAAAVGSEVGAREL